MFTKQKSMQACTKTHHFEIKNAKIFWEKPPPHTPSPRRWSSTGHPPPKKILVTALDRNVEKISCSQQSPWYFIITKSFRLIRCRSTPRSASWFLSSLKPLLWLAPTFGQVWKVLKLTLQKCCASPTLEELTSRAGQNVDSGVSDNNNIYDVK